MTDESWTDSLPEGWARATVSAFTEKVGSGATPRGGSDVYVAEGVPLIRSQNVHFDCFSDEGLAHIQTVHAEALKEVTVQTDDVLLNITGASIGRVCLAPGRMKGARVNQHVSIIRTIREVVEPAFLGLVLRSPVIQSRINSEEYGVTRQALTKEWICNLEVPVPPISEQKRIVEQVEVLLARVNAARERLDKVPAILKRFRQSVLAAAYSGMLTGDWRRSAKTVEAARTLIVRLAGSRAVASVPSDEDPVELPEVPESWAWSRCENLCDSDRAITYGVIKLGPPTSNGIATLRSSDVRWLRVDPNDVKRISASIAAQYERTFLNGGEIVVTVRGTLGGVAVVPAEMKGFNISREVAMLPILLLFLELPETWIL